MKKVLLLLALLAVPASGQQTIWLSLSANGAQSPTFYRGWPLLLEAAAFLARGDQATLDWPGPLRLTITDSQGNVQSWPLESLGATAGPVVLSPNQTASNIWGLTGEATAAIPDGDYVLSVVHPSTDTARSVLLKVGKEPDSLSSDDALLKSRVASRMAEFHNDLSGALGILDDALSKFGDDIGLLSQEADVLEAMGRVDDAVVAAARALRLFQTMNPDGSAPMLSRRLYQLLDEANSLSPASRNQSRQAR